MSESSSDYPVWTGRRRSTKTRKLAVAGTVLATVFSLAACSSSSKSGTGSTNTTAGGSGTGSGPYKVAIVGQLTGGLAAPTGLPAVAGYKTAIAKINAAGGIKGHQIQIVGTFDGQSTPTGSQQAAQQAVATHPDVILTGLDSSGSLGTKPALENANIPTFYAFVDPTLDVPVVPWAFNTSTSIGQITKGLVTGAQDAIGGSLQGKKVALIGISSSGTLVALNQMKSQFTQGGATVTDLEETPLSGVTSFASQAQNVVSGKPNVVVIIDAPTSTVVEAKALKTAGYNGPMVSAFGANGASVFQAINNPNYMAQVFVNPPNPGTALAQDAATYGQSQYATGSAFTQGFVGAYAMADILGKCGFPCSTSRFISTAEADSNIPVPDDAFPGTFGFSASSHHGFQSYQYVKLDPSTGKIVPTLPLIDIKGA